MSVTNKQRKCLITSFVYFDIEICCQSYQTSGKVFNFNVLQQVLPYADDLDTIVETILEDGWETTEENKKHIEIDRLGQDNIKNLKVDNMTFEKRNRLIYLSVTQTAKIKWKMS